jgi:hypothetical protein
MPLPKKIKKYIPLTEPKTLMGRREELLGKINKDGTYLPKSLLHADLDRGFLDFVKDSLKTVVEGKVIPTVDIIITTQNWSQFTETWNFQNIDKNAEPPFITTVRIPEVKYGTNPAVVYTIPNRRLYFYAQVPTWDGQRNGMDIYKIPQPVPVDITYNVKIVCNRMRELNKFNQIVIEKFSSRQSYQNIKGHYIPIVLGNITDESVFDIEKRKYYIQTYEFTMLGFLIDEDEFEVSPAINRILQVVEMDTSITKKRPKLNSNPESTSLTFTYDVDELVKSELFYYTVNLNLGDTLNVASFDIFINNEYYGSDLPQIQINNNDRLRVEIIKNDNTKQSKITFNNLLV